MGLKSKIETNTSTINDIVTKLNGKKLLVKTIDKEITSNGEFTPPSGYVGFSKVKVAVGSITGVTYNNGEITINGSNAGAISNYDYININVYNGSIAIYKHIEVSVVGTGGCVYATNLSPENIKKDVNILGVTGTLESGGGAITGVTYNNGEITIDGSNATQLFNYDDIYLDVYNGKVIIDNEDIEVSVGVGGSVSTTNLSPENIKKGVTILGVTGTLAGGGGAIDNSTIPTYDEVPDNPTTSSDSIIQVNGVIYVLTNN